MEFTLPIQNGLLHTVLFTTLRSELTFFSRLGRLARLTVPSPGSRLGIVLSNNCCRGLKNDGVIRDTPHYYRIG